MIVGEMDAAGLRHILHTRTHTQRACTHVNDSKLCCLIIRVVQMKAVK